LSKKVTSFFFTKHHHHIRTAVYKLTK